MSRFRFLATSMGLFWLVSSLTGPAAWAMALFAGIQDIQALPIEGKTQRIRVVADLPFDYQVLPPLNENQVVIRFLNARLAAELQTENGVLPMQTEQSGITNATIRVSDQAQTEIVFIGPNLARKKLVLEGGHEIALSTADKKALQAPRVKITSSDYTPNIPTETAHSPFQFSPIVPKNGGIQFPLKGTPRSSVRNPQSEALPETPSARMARPEFLPEVQSSAALDRHEQQQAIWQNAVAQHNLAAADEGQEAETFYQPNQTYEAAEHTQPEGTYQPAPQQIAQTTSNGWTESLEEVTIPAPQKKRFSAKKAPKAETPGLRPKSEIVSKDRLDIDLAEHETVQPAPMISARPHEKTIVHFPEETPSQPMPQQRQMANTNPYYASPQQAAAIEPTYNTLAYSAATPVQAAINQFQQKRYADTEETLEGALKSSPRDASLYAALGELYIEQHRYLKAQMAYAQAYTIQNRDYGVRYAETLVLTQQRGQAIALLKKITAQKDNAPKAEQLGKAFYLLGTLHEENGDTTNALTALQQAVKYLPQDADIQYNLALAYELSGNIALAKTHYTKSAQLNPNAEDTQQALDRVKAKS